MLQQGMQEKRCGVDLLQNPHIRLKSVGGVWGTNGAESRLVQVSEWQFVIEEKLTRREPSGNHTYWVTKHHLSLYTCTELEYTLLRHLVAVAADQESGFVEG